MKQQTPGRIVPTEEEARSEIERTLTESKIASDMTRFLDAERDRAEIDGSRVRCRSVRQQT